MDVIIEEVLPPYSEQPSSNEAGDSQKDCDVVAPVSCDVADQALNVLLQFLQKHDVSETYLRHIGQVSFVTAQYLPRQKQPKLAEWLRSWQVVGKAQ